MASAPIILSRQNFGGLQALPQAATGERLSQAQIAGARDIAAAEIGGVQRETAAEIGMSRSVTSAAMQASDAQVKFAGAVNQQATQIGNAILEAQQQTRQTQDQLRLLKGYEEKRSAFRNDPDWQTAPQRLEKGLAEVEAEVFKGYGEQGRARLEAATFVARRSLQREVEQTSLAKMGNAALASQTEASQLLLNQASRSPSAAERSGLIAQNDAAYDGLVSRGIIDATAASTAKQNFRANLDQTELYKGINANPEATLKALDDPEMFKSLTPIQRETAREQARAAQATRINNEAGVAVQRDRVAALATYGIVISADDVGRAGAIYDRIVQQESGGRADAKSVQGALGVGQLMPATARAMAARMGLPEKDLPEAEFRERLLADPVLNRRLGFAYFQLGLRQSEGSLPAAVAGYHMGQERAAKIHQQAKAQFGEGYSAAQYISLIPADLKDGSGKFTRDYVADIYQRMGARVDRGGATGNAVYAVARTVESGAATQDNRDLQQLQKLVSVSQDGRDAVLESFKSGYAVDPAAVAAAKAPLIAAAAAGDARAVQSLREFTEMEQNAPIVRHAYTLPPAALEAGVAELRAAVAAGQSDPASLRRLKVFEAVSSEVATQRNQNPVGLVERAGRQPVTAIQADAPLAQLGEALQLRAPVAAEAMRVYGGDLKLLKPLEAQGLKARWDQAGGHERFELVKTMAANLPQRAYEAMVKQVAGDDAVATIAGVISRRDPETARMVMRGVELMGQAGVDAKASELRPALQAALGSDVYPAAVQKQLIDAAQAHYVAAQAGKGALFDVGDSAAMQASIEAVAGRMAKRGGVKVPLPPGMRPAQLDTVMDGLSEAEIGGAPLGLGGQPIAIEHLRRYARLRPQGVGDGIYSVTLPGPQGKDAAVFAADGKPLVLDMGALATARAPVAPNSRDGFQTRLGAGIRQQDGLAHPDWQGPEQYRHNPFLFQQELQRMRWQGAPGPAGGAYGEMLKDRPATREGGE